MFLGLEPPDYHSTGTDLTNSSTTTAENGFIFGTNAGTAGSFLALYPDNSSTSLTTVTAAAAATTLPARVNVTATAISGATSASYTVSSAAASDNGFYFCKVTNSSGSTYSNTVALTIALNANGNLYQNTASAGTSPAPVITTQPSSATVVTGTSVTFSLVASNSYQWYFGGSAINGATSSSYGISSVTTANAGSYYVVVTNTVGTSTGSTTSSTATLTVNSAPTITTQPSSLTVGLGNSATLSVVATGTGVLAYQWYHAGTAISGATSSSYTIAATTSSSAGSYYVIVSNGYGSVTSSTVTLTLQEPFAAFLAQYNLTGTDPTTDSDGDGISNLVEFVLGGDSTTPGTGILPTVSYVTSGGTTYLVYGFYTVANLGSATWTVESSTDLSTWTTAVSGTGGVVITTTADSSAFNYTTVSIPNPAGSSLFARLRATLPSTYSGTITGRTSSSKGDSTTVTTTTIKTSNNE